MQRVYIFKDLYNVKKEDINELTKLIPNYRREKASTYKFELDRILCVTAFLLLKYILRTEFSIREDVELIYGDFGKPYIKNYNEIYFNLSHCKRGIVCAVSRYEVGVDVQDIQEYDEGIAQMACNDEELELLKNSINKQELFCKMWTIKESYIKADGRGMFLPLKSINTCNSIIKTLKYDDIIIAASRNMGEEIIVEDIQLKVIELEILKKCR